MGNGNGNGRYLLSGNQVVPWIAVLIASASLFWTAVNPHDDLKTERIDRTGDIRQLRQDIEKEIGLLLTKAQYTEFSTRTDKDMDRLRNSLIEMRRGMVSRDEHVQHWNQQQEAIASLRESIADIRKEVGSAATIGDQFKRIEQEIAQIRDARMTAPGAVRAAPAEGR
jgi:hypothetical protein